MALAAVDDEFLKKAIDILSGEGDTDLEVKAAELAGKYGTDPEALRLALHEDDLAEEDERIVKGLLEASVDKDSSTSDTEDKKAEQEKRASACGIAVKDSGHLTRPSKYSDVPDEEDAWMDWTNYKYPISTEAYTRAAASYWGKPKNKSGYSSDEQSKMDARLEAAKKKFDIGEDKEDKTAGNAQVDTTEIKTSGGVISLADRIKRQRVKAAIGESATDEQIDAVLAAMGTPESKSALDTFSEYLDTALDNALISAIDNIYYAFVKTYAGAYSWWGDDSRDPDSLEVSEFEAVAQAMAAAMVDAYTKLADSGADEMEKALSSSATFVKSGALGVMSESIAEFQEKAAKVDKKGKRHSKHDQGQMAIIHGGLLGLGYNGCTPADNDNDADDTGTGAKGVTSDDVTTKDGAANTDTEATVRLAEIEVELEKVKTAQAETSTELERVKAEKQMQVEQLEREAAELRTKAASVVPDSEKTSDDKVEKKTSVEIPPGEGETRRKPFSITNRFASVPTQFTDPEGK